MKNLITFDPFREFDRFFDNDWFPTLVPMRRIWQPESNVSQTDKEIIVETALPGIDPNEVDITIVDHVLTIKSESKEEKKEKDKKAGYVRREIRAGHYERSLALPSEVKGSEAVAEYDQGILTITIPKADSAKPKKVSVRVKNK